MQADELYALGDARLDRVLEAGGVGEQGDLVGFEGYRLIHTGKPGGRAALAVDDRDVPSQRLTGFLDVDTIEMGDVVLLVAREKYDLFSSVRRWRRSGTLPGR